MRIRNWINEYLSRTTGQYDAQDLDLRKSRSAGGQSTAHKSPIGEGRLKTSLPSDNVGIRTSCTSKPSFIKDSLYKL